MSYLRYGLLAIVLALAVTVALANRAAVTLALWPDSVSAILGFGVSVTLPLFLVVGGAVGLGLLLGLLWEWLRERGMRAEAARLRREMAALRARNPGDRGPGVPGGTSDDILSLVDHRKTTV
jgi:uncharacterized integral membrane protein